jgi:hypothetical protein
VERILTINTFLLFFPRRESIFILADVFDHPDGYDFVERPEKQAFPCRMGYCPHVVKERTMRVPHAMALFLAISASLYLPGKGYPAEKGNTGFEVVPTVLFVREGDLLRQVLQVSIENTEKAADARLTVSAGGKSSVFRMENIKPGPKVYHIAIPEQTEVIPAKCTLQIGAKSVETTVTLAPHRKWTVYLFHHSHSDIGYTELQSRVAQKHTAYLDSVIEYCRQTDSYPDDAKFRWNVEITWSLQNFIAGRPEARVRELMNLAKAGRVEIGAWYLQMSDCFSHEELIRNMYLAREIREKYGVPVTSAMNNDVNGFAWGVPQVLAKSGVKYFVTGINETRSRAPLNRPCAFWWESPDRSRILHWNGEHYLFANYDLLLHEGCDRCAPKLSAYLLGLEQRSDYPYEITGLNVGAWVTDNCPPGRKLSDIVREWNSRFEYPKLRLALMREFCGEFERRYGDRIPTYRLGWPDYWTDGVASTAFETGLNRVTHSDLIAAEKVSAIASLVDSAFLYPAEEIAETYDQSMLFDEHTWGAHTSISEPYSELTRGQWAFKSVFAYRAREQSRDIIARGMKMLARNIPAEEDYSFIVFNTLSWERTDVVRISLPPVLVDKNGAFLLIDRRTGENIPFQLMDRNTLVFTVRGAPPLGYTVYTIRTEAGSRKPSPPGVPGLLENRFYRVILDPVTGGIKSIFDKELNIELADSQSPWRLNQYIYENPEGGRPAVDNMKERTKFKRFSPSAAILDTALSGPVIGTVAAHSSCKPCLSIVQEVTLPGEVKRIDIVNTLIKNEVMEPEALYWAFPFAVPGGVFRFETADAAMHPETEQLPKTTRDWMAVQQWVEISGKDYSVVWSPVEAPLVQFGDINTGKWLLKLDISNASLFSYAMNNYWMTNFKAGQGGEVSFRYSITSRKSGADDLASSRFGWESHSPLLTTWIPSGNRGTLSAPSRSLFTIDRPNVIVQTIKRAEDENGYIVRLREISGKDIEVRLSSPLFPAEKTTCLHTDMGERDTRPAAKSGDSFVISMPGYGIETIRLRQDR